MFRNASRFSGVCLLALLAGFGTLFVGRVWAGWSPPRPELSFSNFLVGGDTPSERFTAQFPIQSTHPECPIPIVTISWTDPLGSPSVSEAKLRWNLSGHTIEFEVSSDCQLPSELEIYTDWQSTLPWGFAQGQGMSTLAEFNTHIVPVSSQPTRVRWFVGNAVDTYFFTLRPQSSEESQDLPFVQPLIASWWQGGTTSPCHKLLSIFLPSTLCTTGWWQRFSSPLVSPESVPALPQPGQIIISEVSWAGSFRGNENLSTDEWIELTNLSPEPISLQGLQILGARSSGQTLSIDQPLVIAPYGVAVISRLPSAQSQLQTPADWTTSQLVLSNTEAQLVLELPDGTELDRTPDGPWQVGKNVTGITPLRASAQRLPATVGEGSDWDSWHDCSDVAEEWCRTLSGRAYKADTTNTWGTPGMTWP